MKMVVRSQRKKYAMMTPSLASENTSVCACECGGVNPAPLPPLPPLRRRFLSHPISHRITATTTQHPNPTNVTSCGSVRGSPLLQHVPALWFIPSLQYRFISSWTVWRWAWGPACRPSLLSASRPLPIRRLLSHRRTRVLERARRAAWLYWSICREEGGAGCVNSRCVLIRLGLGTGQVREPIVSIQLLVCGEMTSSQTRPDQTRPTDTLYSALRHSRVRFRLVGQWRAELGMLCQGSAITGQAVGGY